MFHSLSIEPDNIGPEMVAELYDPETGMRAVVALDTLAFGRAAGGTRMLPDISVREIVQLSRAMTYKFAAFGIPQGGAKAGVWADPALTGPERERLLSAFGRAIGPLVRAGVFATGSDMGTNAADFPIVYRAAMPDHLRSHPRPQDRELRDGEPLGNHLTGFGVAVATRTACQFLGLPLKGATAAVEGFGKVGGGAVRYLSRLGVRVVALSTIYGALYEPEGLDLERLFALRRQHADRAVLEYGAGQLLPPAELFTLPVDITVPGARPWVIDKDNAGRVQARVVVGAANIPVTPEADALLFQRRVAVVPDFIANAGGVISAIAFSLGCSVDETFALIERAIATVAREVLEQSHRHNLSPLSFAMEQGRQKVLEARCQGVSRSWEEAAQSFARRFAAGQSEG